MTELQFAQIRPLLAHACETVPFYQEKFGDAGLSLSDDHLLEHWCEVPITSREELQTAGNTCVSRAVPPGHGDVLSYLTSGSTGRPLTSLKTGLSALLSWAMVLRDDSWHRRDVRGRLAAIRTRPRDFPREGIVKDTWGAPHSLIFETGPTAILNIGEGVEAQWQWLKRHDPHYLLTYPSNIQALADYALKVCDRLDSLLEVRAIGETVSKDLWETCREAFGVPMVDVYSAEEIGCIALQCPECESYHVQSEFVLVEVLDDQDRPCGPGEIGRVVITALHNFAMPMIRYDILDYAEVGDPCSCGRGLPVLKRIVGRQRNLLTLPDGRRVWPRFGVKGYLKIAPILQLQVVQHSMLDIEARVVTQRPMSEAEREAFVAHLHDRLRYPFPVRVTTLREIPRAESGKFEDFLSLIV